MNKFDYITSFVKKFTYYSNRFISSCCCYCCCFLFFLSWSFFFPPLLSQVLDINLPQYFPFLQVIIKQRLFSFCAGVTRGGGVCRYPGICVWTCFRLARECTLVARMERRRFDGRRGFWGLNHCHRWFCQPPAGACTRISFPRHGTQIRPATGRIRAVPYNRILLFI